MVKIFSDCLITGACHAPVDSRQRRGLIRRRRNVMNILAICLELKNCKGGPETGVPMENDKWKGECNNERRKIRIQQL